MINKLEERRELGRLTYSAYIHWVSVLENISDKSHFVQGIAEDTPTLRKWRRATPFVGILTETERQAALTANAMGELKNVPL